MNNQIFQTKNKWRWFAFKWSGRLVIIIIIILFFIVLSTLIKGIKPQLPLLIGDKDSIHFIKKLSSPLDLKKSDLRKYKGFEAFLKMKEANEKNAIKKDIVNGGQIRAAFYVDWDPQSFFSLEKNIDKLNMVMPEWFFIDPATDTIYTKIDTTALMLMRKKGIKILPILNNTNSKKGVGEFDGKILNQIIHHPEKRERLISELIKILTQNKLQGVNIDFEDFIEKTDEPIIDLQKELYSRLHEKGLLVTQDITPDDDDFNLKKLAQYNDYMFLMAYDEHFGTSNSGPISSQKFIEKTLDETAKNVPSEKIILCFAGYGYDWQKGVEATSLTYQQALVNAKQYNSKIDFDNDTYNNYYSYQDNKGIIHDVYFTDAASNFNTIRFADEYGIAGTALWRLGSEDERLWDYYARNLSNASLLKKPFDYSALSNVNISVESPDYIGDGEVLNVITTPQPGKIKLEIDTSEGIITEQKYIQLPTKYVIRKYGNVHNQVILTFDDGPDPEYTPKVLDILKKEKIPATFFVVGTEAESNLPILKRIFDEGHEIGNHTFTHPNIAAVSTERASTEMESTRLLIEAVTGRSTILFRAPFNADSEPTKDAELRPIALSKKKNYYTIGESIDPSDWEPGVSADTIYYRTIRQYEKNPEKGIILFHDAGGNRQSTVDALPRIIKYFKDRKIAFTTVASLLHTTKDIIMPPVKNKLINFEGTIATIGYWFTSCLNWIFWTAILLGILRILIVGTMAILNKIKTIKQKKSNASFVALKFPSVSIIVPAYNEEINISNTIRNLLNLDYCDFEIIVVDDGSKDNTYKLIQEEFAYNTKVKIFTKSNGGKASALNLGIAHSSFDYLICIDADTQLMPDAVSKLMECFIENDNKINPVGAIAGIVKVGNEKNMLTQWQSIEYITSQNFERRAFDLINCITVIPGAIGAFKKEAIKIAGGFTSDTLAEDCDLTIRILRNNFRVLSCTDAFAVTEAPETLKQFMKQRFRWSYGIMQSFWKNKDACFNPAYKSLGLFALPNILIFQIILPIIAPLADIMFIIGIIWNRNDPVSLHKLELFYLLFFFIDFFTSVIAFSFEKEKLSKLIWLIPQRLIYRQLMYIILFRSIRRAIKGDHQNWGVLKRTGNVNNIKHLTG
jgi:cellulose synthase/poly-beta-1,6-N-acetylglucosamine synthase-like glycosyltransferase/spore germination protein YaaH/peptidoglycan/xylan/chitin deacetylase (PgdA/CDA1 family)